MSAHRWSWIVGLLLLGVACGDRPAQVTAVQVGRTRNVDKSIAQPIYDFRRNDTMYAAVMLEGRESNVHVTGRWTTPGGMSNESEQVVDVDEQGVAAFELRSSGGFPPGRYRFEAFMNGASVGAKDMQVRP